MIKNCKETKIVISKFVLKIVKSGLSKQKTESVMQTMHLEMVSKDAEEKYKKIKGLK